MFGRPANGDPKKTDADDESKQLLFTFPSELGLAPELETPTPKPPQTFSAPGSLTEVTQRHRFRNQLPKPGDLAQIERDDKAEEYAIKLTRRLINQTTPWQVYDIVPWISAIIALLGATCSASSVYYFANRLVGKDASMALKAIITIAAGVPAAALSFTSNFATWSNFFSNYRNMTDEQIKHQLFPLVITALSVFASFRVNWNAWAGFPLPLRISMSLGRAILSSLGNNFLFMGNQIDRIHGDRKIPSVLLLNSTKKYLTGLAKTPDYEEKRFPESDPTKEKLITTNHYVKALDESGLFSYLVKLDDFIKPNQEQQISGVNAINSLFNYFIDVVNLPYQPMKPPQPAPEEPEAKDNSCFSSDAMKERLFSILSTCCPEGQKANLRSVINNCFTDETKEKFKTYGIAAYAFTGGGFLMYLEAGLGVIPELFLGLSGLEVDEYKKNHPLVYWLAGGLCFALESALVNGSIAAVALPKAIALIRTVWKELKAIHEKEGLLKHMENMSVSEWGALALRIITKTFFIGGYGMTQSGQAYEYPPFVKDDTVRILAAVVSFSVNAPIGSMSINNFANSIKSVKDRKLFHNAIDTVKRGGLLAWYYHSLTDNQRISLKLLFAAYFEYLFQILLDFFNTTSLEIIHDILDPQLKMDLATMFVKPEQTTQAPAPVPAPIAERKTQPQPEEEKQREREPLAPPSPSLIPSSDPHATNRPLQHRRSSYTVLRPRLQLNDSPSINAPPTVFAEPLEIPHLSLQTHTHSPASSQTGRQRFFSGGGGGGRRRPHDVQAAVAAAEVSVQLSQMRTHSEVVVRHDSAGEPSIHDGSVFFM